MSNRKPKKYSFKYRQLTIDEYIEAQEDLFPDDKPAGAASEPRPAAAARPGRLVFPGAIDGIGAVPEVQPARPLVVRRRAR